ncbi:MAG: Short-chain dehydrogenase, partial [Bacteroidota bacterium]|nr:Short-chain dehydrogenase [Bacteroidota bacterium]
IIKEIKPTAAIAWKKIAYDTVKRGGRAIPLVDMDYDIPRKITSDFEFSDISGVVDLGEDFKSVFIDTGENGIFSKGEFQAITSIGQMEFVTPEEIAEYAVFEIKGGNTGFDLIQGIDGFTLGPTYRGGMLQHIAVNKIDELEAEHGVDSIAFELLGPPRLSKLLFEAYILRRIVKSINGIINSNAEELSFMAAKLIKSDKALRSQMLSIGLVVLLPDGQNYLRGSFVKIPAQRAEEKIEVTPERINNWCEEGWIDLRIANFEKWISLANEIKAHALEVASDDTSSRYTYTTNYWDNFETINEGKIIGWVFEHKDKGWRFKR